jgi:hypothetical protein
MVHMISLAKAFSALALAGGLVAIGTAQAQPVPPPPPPLPAESDGAPVRGEVPPNWAPPKPAEVWNGEPVVWFHGWGGRWGVWKNGAFIPLTSNPVTGGG